MIREPLNCLTCTIPIVERSFVSWFSSPRTLVYNLLHTLTVPPDALPPHIRQINLPGISVSIQGMMDVLAKVAGEDVLKYLEEENDEKLIPILKSWPKAFDNAPALELGYEKDVSFEDIVRDYKNFLLQS